MRARLVFVLALYVVVSLIVGGRAQASPITVVVNGQQVQFDQPPIERAGRVFVPLRGVFEKLGASVVYDNGLINATGNNTTIQVRIGSTTAQVNGNPEKLDVAPFIVGTRTYVPLRFISEALGATVNYNDSSRTVSITGGGGASTRVTLTNLKPASGAVVSAKSPAVSGSFSSAVDPNSVHITLDGRDVSNTTDISGTDFLFTPPYPLVAQSHTVRVTGKSTNGSAFDQQWSFTSGTSTIPNFLKNLAPANGSTVGNTFSVTGSTLPNSHVHIVVTPVAVLGGVFTVSSATSVSDAVADSSGNFAQSVNVSTVPGGSVSVRVTSIAPTNASATANLSLKS